MGGIKIKTFALNNKNGEALNINGGELSAGTYIYTLVVDDVMVDSKKMILTKDKKYNKNADFLWSAFFYIRV